MKLKMLIAASAVGLMSLAQTAVATPITFSFESATPGIHSVASPYTQTINGVTVDATANGDLYNTRQGMGVGADAFISTDEELSFTFAPSAVHLLSGVVFESAASISGADFDLYGDGTLLSSVSILNTWTTGGSYFTSLDFGNWAATVFTFAGLSDNGFRVKRLTVDVPEPSVIALLGTGLLLMGISSRRRRKLQ